MYADNENSRLGPITNRSVEMSAVGASFQRSLDGILHALSSGARVVVLSGEPGTGKSALLGRLAQQLDEPVRLAHLGYSHLEYSEFLAFIGLSLEAITDVAIDNPKNDAVIEHLRDERRRGRNVVIVVDDAHHMCRSVLRRLVDVFELDQSAPLAQFVLAGTDALELHLDNHASPRLRACIDFQTNLARLNPQEIDGFITAALAARGPRGTTITDEARRFLSVRSFGVLRLLENAFDGALMVAAESGSSTVTLACASTAWARTFGTQVIGPHSERAITDPAPAQDAETALAAPVYRALSAHESNASNEPIPTNGSAVGILAKVIEWNNRGVAFARAMGIGERVARIGRAAMEGANRAITAVRQTRAPSIARARDDLQRARAGLIKHGATAAQWGKATSASALRGATDALARRQQARSGADAPAPGASIAHAAQAFITRVGGAIVPSARRWLVDGWTLAKALALNLRVWIAARRSHSDTPLMETEVDPFDANPRPSRLANPRLLIGLGFSLFAGPIVVGVALLTFTKSESTEALVQADPPARTSAPASNFVLSGAAPIQLEPVRVSTPNASASTSDEDAVLAYLSGKPKAQSDGKPAVVEANIEQNIDKPQPPAAAVSAMRATLADLYEVRADIEVPTPKAVSESSVERKWSSNFESNAAGLAALALGRAAAPTVRSVATISPTVIKPVDEQRLANLAESKPLSRTAPSADQLTQADTMSVPVDSSMDPAEPTRARVAAEHAPIAKTYPVETVNVPDQTRTYRVTRGDSLLRIAGRFDITLTALLAENQGLSPNAALKIGQKLSIPMPNQIAQKWYSVRTGDTLWEISKRLAVPVSDIKALNGLSASRIVPGQRLRLPPET
ncbi:MAG: LysM peptidoglycan-binding domain-containing protein [Gammaproteobacteria bacterium]|nr:LysM peptidoglycan-binding domain-containing protein [Gammaproteobacteria bacterium]